LEWNSGVGFCGEQSIQSIGLYYGAYISQYYVRSVAGGPVVLGGLTETVIGKLHFNYVSWDFDGASNPEFQSFVIWMKSYLARGIPVIMAEWVADHDMPDPDYDHLLPVFGVQYTAAQTYDPKDVIIFNNLVNTGSAASSSPGTMVKTVGSLTAPDLTGTTCKTPSYSGGCVPWNVDYGAAILGIIDADHATVPVHVSVNSPSEPDVSIGHSPTQLMATVTVEGLKAGGHYTLLRYDGHTNVPESGAPADYLKSKFRLRRPPPLGPTATQRGFRRMAPSSTVAFPIDDGEGSSYSGPGVGGGRHLGRDFRGSGRFAKPKLGRCFGRQLHRTVSRGGGRRRGHGGRSPTQLRPVGSSALRESPVPAPA
jgi:hypothetical protein